MANWSKQQRKLFTRARAALEYWEARGYKILWVTLTSSPQSPDDSLFDQHDKLKKRILREYGYRYEHVIAETSEGHGVLHMFWAWLPPVESPGASFYIDFNWLRKQWFDIHRAVQLKVVPYQAGPDDALKLSRYIVQYVAGQDKLVRWNASLLRVNGLSIGKLSSGIMRVCREDWPNLSLPSLVRMPSGELVVERGWQCVAYAKACLLSLLRRGWVYVGPNLYIVLAGELQRA